jgi:hypothetical protein
VVGGCCMFRRALGDFRKPWSGRAGRRGRSSGLSSCVRAVGGVGALSLVSLVIAASASALNMTGTWQANYACEAGWCVGGNFPATDVLTQAEGSDQVTGGNGVETITGTVSGNTFNIHNEAGGYTAGGALTVAANGLSWSGPLSDSNGTSGTYTATRAAVTLSGTVTGVNGHGGVGGVTIAVSGASSATATTAANGSYSLQLAAGTYTVTPTAGPGAVFTPPTATVNLNGESGPVNFQIAYPVSGTVQVSNCGDSSCSPPKPLEGALVTAKALDPGMGATATSAVDGTWSMNLAPGSYSLVPSHEEDEFDPSQLEVGVTGVTKEQNFTVCVAEASGASVARTSPKTEPCKRRYTFTLGAWIPQASVADPIVGSDVYTGASFPNSSTSFFHFAGGQDTYPPCLPESLAKDYAKDRVDVLWRARFTGSGNRTPQFGLGNVSVPVAYDGAGHQVELVGAPFVRPGTMNRAYDWMVKGGSTVSTCNVTLPTTATVDVKVATKNEFKIEASWGVPFTAYPSPGDVHDITTSIKAIPTTDDAIDALLKDNKKYADAPKIEKTKIREWTKVLAGTLGLKKGIKAIDAAIAEGKDLLLNSTPPVIKGAEKVSDAAAKAMSKLSYGSADVIIRGVLKNTEPQPPLLAGQTTLTITEETDDWPSFSLFVERSQAADTILPWVASTSSTVVENSTFGSLPENVLTDGTTFAQEVELAGGPGAKLKLAGALNILDNVTHKFVPGAAAAILPPIIEGKDTQKRTITWRFPGAHS